jgi:hypothetical protein
MHTFDCGIPDFDSMIYVEGIGPAQLRHFYEDGEVLLYVGGGRTFRVSGSHRWRYAGRG